MKSLKKFNMYIQIVLIVFYGKSIEKKELQLYLLLIEKMSYRLINNFLMKLKYLENAYAR